MGWLELFQESLNEDRVQNDWTTRAVCPDVDSDASVIAKSSGVWAADGLVAAVLSSSSLELRVSVANGQAIEGGQPLIEMSGRAQEILGVERTFLNIASYTCGIATQTRNLVKVIEASKLDPAPRLTSTRKVLPGFRDVVLDAVVAGGGFPHRRDLASGILIKENHIELVGSIEKAISSAKANAPHGLRIEVEIQDLEELDQVDGADIVMLDNFSPDEVRKAVGKKKNFALEVSGGINKENIGDYCIQGVDIISVGSLTHSVKAVDLSLLIS